MSINQFKKLLFFLVIGGFTCWVASWLFLNLELLELIENIPFNRNLRIYFTKRLVKIYSSPYTVRESPQNLEGIIYVMGGSQRSLKYRFQTAAELHHKGMGKKLLLLSEPGISEYDPQIGRNLTNDEWAVNKLVEFGVQKEDIELVILKKGHLGTFTEAEGISDIVLRRGYRSLILVTSSSHTMRTWLSFSEFLKDKNTALYIYASNDGISLYNLLIEYSKLLIYKNFVLPINDEAKKVN